jgi:hypothetical protein
MKRITITLSIRGEESERDDFERWLSSSAAGHRADLDRQAKLARIAAQGPHALMLYHYGCRTTVMLASTYAGRVLSHHCELLSRNDHHWLMLYGKDRPVAMPGSLFVLRRSREWDADVIKRYLKRYKFTDIDPASIRQRLIKLVEKQASRGGQWPSGKVTQNIYQRLAGGYEHWLREDFVISDGEIVVTTPAQRQAAREIMRVIERIDESSRPVKPQTKDRRFRWQRLAPSPSSSPA